MLLLVLALGGRRTASAQENSASVFVAENRIFFDTANDIRSSDDRDDDKDDGSAAEVVLSFRFAGLVETDLSVRFLRGDVYLPVGELFSALHIDWDFDREASTLSGFFVAESQTYRVDFRQNVAMMGADASRISPSDYLVERYDVFVRPALLEKIFGFHVSVDVQELAVFLRADGEMPVETARRRERERPLLVDPYAALRHAPLVYDRERKLLGGGVADYGISINQTASGTSLGIQGGVGIEVLGGDLVWSGRTGIHDRPYVAHDHVRWRYVMQDNPYLRQLQVGGLHSTGLHPTPYRGVHLSNQRATPKVFFGEYAVTGEAEPDWEIELYMDDRLVGLTRTDASGIYRFNVPLVFGTSQLRIRSFGPTGEVSDRWRRIQIPFTMLTPGELEYNAHLGEDSRSRSHVAQADVAYGFSEHVTAKAGIEYLPGRWSDRPFAYGSITSRIQTHYLASLSVSPYGLQQLSVSGHFPSHSSVDLRYSRIDGSRTYLFQDSRSRLTASSFIPFYLGHYPMSFRIEGSRTTIGDDFQYGTRAYLNASFSGFQFYLHGRSEWSTNFRRTRLSPSVTYSLSRANGGRQFLRGLLLTARAHYEVEHRSVQSVELNVAHNIARNARLQVLANLGFDQMPTTVGFRLSWDLPFARATTDARMNGSHPYVAQTFRGSIVANPSNDRFLFEERPAVGRSAAALRLFVDRNANGVLDDDEHVLENGSVRLERGSGMATRRSGSVTRVSDLAPYQRYTAQVDESSIVNPLWVPSRESFSFIADPNAVKPIDVPLFAAGVVQGAVLERRSGRQYPVPGIRVRLIHVETGKERILRTFSDGSFYEMGLPPGTYEARLDDVQLAAHELALVTSVMHFDVRPTENGDYVDGIDFIVEAETAPPGERILTEKQEQGHGLSLISASRVPIAAEPSLPSDLPVLPSEVLVVPSNALALPSGAQALPSGAQALRSGSRALRSDQPALPYPLDADTADPFESPRSEVKASAAAESASPRRGPRSALGLAFLLVFVGWVVIHTKQR